MMFHHHDGSAGDPRLPDLISILGDAPGMENLRTLARVRRDYAERMVETLIDALDAIDGDPDLEPSLGSGNASPPTGRFAFGRHRRVRFPMADHLAFAHGADDDREEQDEDGDDLDQGEGEHDGSEPDCDDERGGDEEPALGSLDGALDQRAWSRGLGSEEGDFDEAVAPAGYARHLRLLDARADARVLLDHHGLRRRVA